jgi:hypothetical protein
MKNRPGVAQRVRRVHRREHFGSRRTVPPAPVDTPALRRPLPDESLVIVAGGSRQDGGGE